MNKADTRHSEDCLESPLREAVDAVCAEPISDEVIEGALTRALELAASSDRAVQPSPSHRRTWLARSRQWLVIAVGAAAMIVAAVFWNHSTGSVLADVVKAVAKKPWMRATGKGPNEVDIEMWYSPRHGIFATRQGTQKETETVFVNVRQETIDVYTREGAGNPVLSRLPIEREQRKLFASQERTFEMLFFGNPIKAFRDGQHELVSHTQKTVRDGDDTFIEHRFTTKLGSDDQRMVTVLRVDAESRLPVSWESTVGKTRVFSCQVDFPARGPQTIYAMGVPRKVEVVDQTPTDDLKRILAAWKTGRTRFDSYRAVVVESSSSDHRASGHGVFQVWRKGRKWRVEQLRMPPRRGSGPFEDEVPADADPKTWWLDRGETWDAIPQTVCDGTLEIRLKRILPEPRQRDPNNPRYGLIVSLEPHRTRAFRHSTTDQRPDDLGLMPEFPACPYIFGRGNWGYQTKVDPHPTDGPEGTVLVEVHKKNPSKLPDRTHGVRYWVDPARNYVVKQMQWLKTGARLDSPRGRVEMREFALSPSGLWYPGVVRVVQNAFNLDDGTTSDTYSRFYVDFEAEIPGELFDVHQWGPIK